MAQRPAVDRRRLTPRAKAFTAMGSIAGTAALTALLVVDQDTTTPAASPATTRTTAVDATLISPSEGALQVAMSAPLPMTTSATTTTTGPRRPRPHMASDGS